MGDAAAHRRLPKLLRVDRAPPGRTRQLRGRLHIYFEDAGGAGSPVLFYTGFADPLEVA
jgi:hypothetical protein